MGRWFIPIRISRRSQYLHYDSQSWCCHQTSSNTLLFRDWKESTRHERKSDCGYSNLDHADVNVLQLLVFHCWLDGRSGQSLHRLSWQEKLIYNSVDYSRLANLIHWDLHLPIILCDVRDYCCSDRFIFYDGVVQLADHLKHGLWSTESLTRPLWD